MCLCQDREWSDREWFAYYEKKVKMAKGKESQLDLNDSHVSDEGGGVGSERSVTSYSFTDCVAWWCAGLLRTLRPLLSLFG